MDRDGFWALIDASLEASGGDREGQCDFLRDDLVSGSTEEILAYGREYDRLMAESYRADLWGAAYLINAGCSDDGFEYFRRWLISRGRRAFEAALRDPDSLADEVSEEGEVEFEEFGVIAMVAYELKTGRGDFHDVDRSPGPFPDVDLIGDLADWADDDGDGDHERLKALFPRLDRKFPCD